MWEFLPEWQTLPSVRDKPASGTPAEWWSDDGRIGFLGHWDNGELVEDRRMTRLESAGGGSALVALIFFGFVSGLVVLATITTGWLSDAGVLPRLGVTEVLLVIAIVLLCRILAELLARPR